MGKIQYYNLKKKTHKQQKIALTVERQGIRPQYGKMEPGDRRDIFHHMALMRFSTSFCHHSEPLEFLGG